MVLLVGATGCGKTLLLRRLNCKFIKNDTILKFNQRNKV